MSYSRVTVKVPKQMVKANYPDKFGDFKPDLQVNFLPMDGLKGKVNVLDPSLEQYKEKLMPYNLKMMEWLQDEKNALAFYQDPMEAFKQAVNPPEELISFLKEAKLTPSDKQQEDEIASKLYKSISENVVSQLPDVASGWDIVVGMRQNAVNKAIQYVYEKGLFPETIVGEFDIPLIGKIKLDAQLASPSMTGGKGSDIEIALTFEKGTIEFPGSPAKTAIDGLIATLTLNLEEVKSPVQPEQGTRYDFMLNIASEKAFVGLILDNLPSSLVNLKTVMEIIMLNVIRNSFAGKEYKVFSADLKGIGDYPFLIPTEIYYAGQSSADFLPAVGALMTTSGNHKGTIQLDSQLFPDNEDVDSVMAMSRDLFLENVGVQGLVNAFRVDKSFFSYNESKHYAYNTKEFNYYEKVKDYTVKIKSAVLKIESGELVLELKARVEPSSGIYIDYEVYVPYAASIKEDENKQSIHFDEDKDRYKESHEVSAEWWVWLLGFLAAIIGALIVLIILAIIDALAPDIGADVFDGAIKDVQWNYLNIAKLKTVDLGDSIRIGCSAEFTGE